MAEIFRLDNSEPEEEPGKPKENKTDDIDQLLDWFTKTKYCKNLSNRGKKYYKGIIIDTIELMDHFCEEELEEWTPDNLAGICNNDLIVYSSQVMEYEVFKAVPGIIEAFVRFLCSNGILPPLKYYKEAIERIKNFNNDIAPDKISWDVNIEMIIRLHDYDIDPDNPEEVKKAIKHVISDMQRDAGPENQPGLFDENDVESQEVRFERISEDIFDLGQELIDFFNDSTLYYALTDKEREYSDGIIQFYFDIAFRYFEETPRRWATDTLEEIVTEVMPAKVAIEREFFESVSPVLSAFFLFMQGEKYIKNGVELSSTVLELHDEIIEKSQDQSRWGDTKAFMIAASEFGVDPTNKEEMEAFIKQYNAEVQPVNNPPKQQKKKKSSSQMRREKMRGKKKKKKK